MGSLQTSLPSGATVPSPNPIVIPIYYKKRGRCAHIRKDGRAQVPDLLARPPREAPVRRGPGGGGVFFLNLDNVRSVPGLLDGS